MAENLILATKIGTAVALFGFVATLIYYAYIRYLKYEENKLALLPLEERATRTDEYLTRYGIDGKDLPVADKVALIRDELNKRHRRAMAYMIVAGVVFTTCFALAAFATRDQGRKNMRGNGNEGDEKEPVINVVRAEFKEKSNNEIDVILRHDGEQKPLIHKGVIRVNGSTNIIRATGLVTQVSATGTYNLGLEHKTVPFEQEFRLEQKSDEDGIDRFTINLVPSGSYRTTILEFQIVLFTDKGQQIDLGQFDFLSHDQSVLTISRTSANDIKKYAARKTKKNPYLLDVIEAATGASSTTEDIRPKGNSAVTLTLEAYERGAMTQPQLP